MRETPKDAAARPMPIGVPLVGLLILAVLAGVPQAQPWLLVSGTWVAVGATLGGMAWYRPAERVAWWLVAGMLLMWGLAGLVDPLVPASEPVRTTAYAALVVAGQLFAFAVGIRLYWIRRHGDPAVRKPLRRGFFPGADEEFGRPHDRVSRYADRLLLVGVLGLVLAQVVTSVQAQPERMSTAPVLTSALDVILGGLLLRFLLSRERMPRALLLTVFGALGIIAGAILLSTARGEQFYVTAGYVSLTVAVGLFVWAPLDPSMRSAFTRAALSCRRSESGRLLGLIPLAVMPVLLYVLGPQDGGRLPALVYLLTGLLLAVVALVRGAAAVLDNERLAVRDWYTGLLNRRGLVLAYRRVDASPERPWQLAQLDLDDFKQINDTFGHYAGDELLVQVARRLRGAVGADGIIGRTGGDEFVLILPPGHASVEQTVEQVFAEPFTVSGNAMPVRASTGVTAISCPRRDEAEVFTEVDIAVYAAKAAGKNTVTVYDPKHREQVLGRQTLLADLRRTMDGDTTAGTLEVYYQPLVELGTGAVTGCEALIRWRHAERGMIRPDDFLGLAETSGLAGDLDRWVLHEALAQVAQWEAEGIGSIYVSTNLGRTSMLDPHLAEVTLEYLRRTGVRPQQLHLEITEHDELPPEAGALTLALLTEAGVRVSLDDFGIGYTSLDYLHRYPVRQLKLDRSITSNLQTAASSPLLEGIVALARSLQVDVVAEGIETEPQRERLAGLGIAYGQGYHLCRPQPAASMTALLRAAGPARRLTVVPENAVPA
ncbi:bifunctional diguanylate cyclase/phosphodiesterase [Kineosporia sp. J2-2]|uniref:Bifunctional diguanylate cyclase/phosphodiesterase n=1 Tax=Kineosporia corallincola TaxID=2835133 RepID=A0ABS5TCK0_9ACTN|nr:bifunctional diguanylate cyclase/phosphodiesterase [Kineosporia corallincola]MBT0768815.1 bifunctional diguanylate cyclase/phosphodiesterase [Kineosporia corallincola]